MLFFLNLAAGIFIATLYLVTVLLAMIKFLSISNLVTNSSVKGFALSSFSISSLICFFITVLETTSPSTVDIPSEKNFLVQNIPMVAEHIYHLLLCLL